MSGFKKNEKVAASKRAQLQKLYDRAPARIPQRFLSPTPKAITEKAIPDRYSLSTQEKE